MRSTTRLAASWRLPALSRPDEVVERLEDDRLQAAAASAAER